jgi:CRISPR/Cas system CSM-associated protein Csm4 (group 5 of RAMP superfamily)
MYKHYIRYHSGEVKKPKIVLPKPPNNINRFDVYNEKHFKKTHRYPFVVYADIESFNLKHDDDASDPKIITRQIPNSYMVFSLDLLFLEEADNHST